MHERGGLQRLVGRFIRHARRRELAQFAVHRWKQLIGGVWIAMLYGFKNAGDVAQPASNIKLPGIAPEDCATAPRPKFQTDDFNAGAGGVGRLPHKNESIQTMKATLMQVRNTAPYNHYL